MMKVKGDNRGQLITCYYPIYIYIIQFSRWVLVLLRSLLGSRLTILLTNFFFLKLLSMPSALLTERGEY